MLKFSLRWWKFLLFIKNPWDPSSSSLLTDGRMQHHVSDRAFHIRVNGIG